ncbi:class I SAM-dependent methyltransferase [bacterium]|nr:class I SAM-dependent methyltransferase [bacterium]
MENISDTARWVAVYRAIETERPDALFKDPFARRLAGERGEKILSSLAFARRNEWAIVMRTHLIDRLLLGTIEKDGIDTVLNLAAGLDARPWRLALPPSLKWIDVDLPEITDWKEEKLRGEKPLCDLERVRLDLADVTARRALFERVSASSRKTLVMTEGLVIYLTREQVDSLAHDLAASASFRYWILDLASPGLVRMMQRLWDKELNAARAPMKFGPEEGPAFFASAGWVPLEVRSLLMEAARHRRLRFFLRLAALLPESKGRQGRRPWSAACLFGRA